MKITTIFGASALILALGGTASARGQHGDGQHGDHDRQEHGRSEERSDKHRGNDHKQQNDQRHDQRQQGREHADHNRQDREYHSQAHGRNDRHDGRRNEGHDVRREARGPVQRRPEPREIWQGHQAHNWEHEHRGWRERGGYRGYRIPDDRFRARFGRGHWFRVRSAPVLVVGGYPRFQYGGFWFSVVDPWPEYWERTWYETDDVYVDYVNDGYYMYNRRHPGVGIAVNVSF